MAHYMITQKDVEGKRLVRADNPSQARKHVSADIFTVSEALNADEVADLMAGGVELEKAKAEAAE